MQIRICKSCGVGVVGQRHCDNCSGGLLSGSAIKTGTGAFLISMAILSPTGIEIAPEASVAGLAAFSVATTSVTPLVPGTDADPDSGLLNVVLNTSANHLR